MRKNVAPLAPRPVTHEGGPADRISPEQALRRAVLCCLLWEDSFYESGVKIADRIAQLVPKVDPIKVGLLAVDTREQYKLRHAPLWLVLSMVRAGGLHRRYSGAVLSEVIQRPDELAEFLSLYWDGTDRRKSKNRKLAAQVKRGLARAFSRFDAYALGKYRAGGVKLRDVMFMTHPKPRDAAQVGTFNALADDHLRSFGTWERELSAGEGEKTAEEKRARWASLLQGNRLGALALLRNLRNMIEAGVDQAEIEKALARCNPERVLPFRFITAARHAPRLEPALEPLMLRCLEGRPKLAGRTVLLVDHSGSMRGVKVSQKSELDRFDAAAALAILARELCQQVTVLAFSDSVWELPPRRGFALRDALAAGDFQGTQLGKALIAAMKHNPDRIIAITDEQTADRIPAIVGGDLRGYMVNVGSYENGVGYSGGWEHVTGWSEAILDFIWELEKAPAA